MWGRVTEDTLEGLPRKGQSNAINPPVKGRPEGLYPTGDVCVRNLRFVKGKKRPLGTDKKRNARSGKNAAETINLPRVQRSGRKGAVPERAYFVKTGERKERLRRESKRQKKKKVLMRLRWEKGVRGSKGHMSQEKKRVR